MSCFSPWEWWFFIVMWTFTRGHIWYIPSLDEGVLINPDQILVPILFGSVLKWRKKKQIIYFSISFHQFPCSSILADPPLISKESPLFRGFLMQRWKLGQDLKVFLQKTNGYVRSLAYASYHVPAHCLDSGMNIVSTCQIHKLYIGGLEHFLFFHTFGMFIPID